MNFVRLSLITLVLQMIEEEEVEVPVSKAEAATDAKEEAMPSADAKPEDGDLGSAENGAADEKPVKMETDTPKVQFIYNLLAFWNGI